MKVGIITFHNSYNCGSMLESYAIYKYIENKGIDCEIVNFSNEGQKELYEIFKKNNSIKNIIRNSILLPHLKKLNFSNYKYEEFKKNNFKLSKEYNKSDEIVDYYDVVVAGSDQIWNITIKDFDDAYFLNWAKNSKKVAYSPSFGARKLSNYTKNIKKYCDYLKNFDAISIRENNGKKWINEMIGIDVPVLIDPTLLFDSDEYDKIIDRDYKVPEQDYIFFYCPQFNVEICKFVKQVSKKYNLPVIAWSAKSYYLKGVNRYNFQLPKYESPAVYLKLIKYAKLVFTTSFHGTIFSTIYRKKFYTIKNGEMYGDDDRVKTLLDNIKLSDRLIPFKYDENYNYMADINYDDYNKNLVLLRSMADSYIEENICHSSKV